MTSLLIRILISLLFTSQAFAQWDGAGNIVRTNGTYSGSDVWAQDRDAGVKITATNHDAHDEGLATAIENCITRDGQNTPSNDLPMGGRKHTGVALSTAQNQYARTDQVQKMAFAFGGTAGTSTAYTMTLSPAPTAYTAGLTIIAQLHTNNGVSPTINVNGLGAVNILTPTGAPASGLLKANANYMMVHDGVSSFYLIGY
jgi:hypothetical protein